MSRALALLVATVAASSAEYVHPTLIKPGCARFYMSNPHSFVKGWSEDTTQYWQVCVAQERDTPAKMAIGAGLFAKIKDKFGADTANSISYISTGAHCWVEIFSGKGQTGETYEITPLADIDLATIPLLHIPDHLSFNDNIISGFIRSTDSDGENPDSGNVVPGQVPVAVWYTFENVQSVPADHGCAYFYDADPTVGLANGFCVCVSDDQHLAHVNVKDMHDRGYSEVLKRGAIKSVHSGEEIEVGVYAEDEFEGHKTIIDQKESHYIHQVVKSFIMISTKYAKQITPEAMFTAAENYLHGTGSVDEI